MLIKLGWAEMESAEYKSDTFIPLEGLQIGNYEFGIDGLPQIKAGFILVTSEWIFTS